MKPTRFPQFLLLLVLLFTASALFAQIQYGQIRGTVTDPQGAAVAGAKVTVTNTATSLSTTTESSSTGLFTVTTLPVGTYKVTVEASGFKTTTANDVVVSAGTVTRSDLKLSIGEASQTVEVAGVAPAIETEQSQLSTTVTIKQVENLPLNGRNVYDLIQLAPGAVNVAGADFENGHNTVVNGLRENFNGFLINGVSNKGLSGGTVNTPIEDSVQEFQQVQLNVSAQYGNSAGSITNLVTKSGTNAYHGNVFWYVRNDMFDANQFLLNQAGEDKPKLRFNQFGASIGGPIIKDKLFFFAAYQGDRLITTTAAEKIQVETQAFRDLVASVYPNSVANLLYSASNNIPLIPGSTLTMTQYGVPFGLYLCADNYSGSSTGAFGADPSGAGTVPQLFANLFGYSPADDAGCPLTANSQGVAYNLAGLANRDLPFVGTGVAIFGQQTGSLANNPNLFNGNEATGRIDWNINDKNHIFGQFNWLKATDTYGPCAAIGACMRGAAQPLRNLYPNAQFSWVHTFSPTIVNEFRAGYVQNNQTIGATIPGMPQPYFDDGTAGFGSYNGYPQFFKEHIYTYGDMVSVTKGRHNMKMGVDIRRNIENSEFNVARPSYEFFDPLFFAIDHPAEEVGGVDPGIISGNPAQLASNVRHWRDVEFGAYFQDDWKVTPRFTLNLGLRWDLFTRHTELNNLTTTFLLGPGNHIIDNITTGAGKMRDATNVPLCTGTALDLVAGTCGPGGFSTSHQLGPNDYNDFGPRVGFAWDVFGDGKTSLRGGFGISYEGELYNPLSNSRWNPPFYSFNIADNFLNGDTSTIVWGPFGAGCPNCATPPSFTGPATNPGQGVGAQAVGNLSGWISTNPNLAYLTGIVFPTGIRDPYVINDFLSVQHEFSPSLVIEADYVNTLGRKLFRSENVNRIPGARLPSGTCTTDNFGRLLCSHPGGWLNPNYGNLRVWENVVNSNYHGLQLGVRSSRPWHGVAYGLNYTWSHAIDGGSTWHSGATTGNGAAAGEGYTTDQTMPWLDRGNSLFDIRHRLVGNYVWEMPFFKGHGGATEWVLGGWSWSGVVAWQTGVHWEPFRSGREILTGDCSQPGINAGLCINEGGDYNLDHGRNDRPDSNIGSFNPSASDWANGLGGAFIDAHFSAPCIGCVGNLGRNTFVGPPQTYWDMTVAKNFKLTERFNLQFRSEFFNVLNHTNFLLAPAGGEGHNNIGSRSSFGAAGATLNPRNIQFALKLSF